MYEATAHALSSARVLWPDTSNRAARVMGLARVSARYIVGALETG